MSFPAAIAARGAEDALRAGEAIQRRGPLPRTPVGLDEEGAEKPRLCPGRRTPLGTPTLAWKTISWTRAPSLGFCPNLTSEPTPRRLTPSTSLRT